MSLPLGMMEKRGMCVRGTTLHRLVFISNEWGGGGEKSDKKTRTL